MYVINHCIYYHIYYLTGDQYALTVYYQIQNTVINFSFSTVSVPP